MHNKYSVEKSRPNKNKKITNDTVYPQNNSRRLSDTRFLQNTMISIYYINLIKMHNTV